MSNIFKTVRAQDSSGLVFKDDGNNTAGGIEDGGYGYMTPHVSTTAALGSNTSYTIAHGLGANPSLVRVTLICDSAEMNYSQGDEAEIIKFYDSGPVVDMAFNISIDATNIIVTTPNYATFTVKDKTSKAVSNGTWNKWKLKVRWWK